MSESTMLTTPSLRAGIRVAVILYSMICVTGPAIGRSHMDTVTIPITVEPGWNLLSLPVEVPGATRESVFPTAISNAFGYDSAYKILDSLTPGQAFWIKFASAESVQIRGLANYKDTLSVRAGWNMIGGLTTPGLVKLHKLELGSELSGYFEFIPGSGYQATDSLKPGRGYWVKVSSDAILVMNAMNVACLGVPEIDYGGMVYQTVQIGEQCWFRENLNIGTMIPGADTSSDNGVIEKYCYDDDSLNCQAYGGLYRWKEAMGYTESPGDRGICPPDWHIPSLTEYLQLYYTVNSSGILLRPGPGEYNNLSGFTCLFAGGGYGGTFGDLGIIAYIWSSSADDTIHSSNMSMLTFTNEISFSSADPANQLSVRCIRDFGDPPGVPENHSPVNADTGKFTSLRFTWSCEDPENDYLKYDLYVGEENPPQTKVNPRGIGDTTYLVQGLNINTTYHWRVVAHDGHGNATEGPVWNFTTGGPFGLPCEGTPTVDYSGKIYPTVRIGNQCWLKENLDVGVMIDSLADPSDNGVVEKYCYNDDTANCAAFGGLYQWSEAMAYATDSGAQGICPPGWHLPTWSDLLTLSSNVSGDGNSLKAVGEGSGNGVGTDASGFSFMLSGLRTPGITVNRYTLFGTVAEAWSSTADSSMKVSYLQLNNSYVYISLHYNFIEGNYGFHVRCIKD